MKFSQLPRLAPAGAPEAFWNAKPPHEPNQYRFAGGRVCAQGDKECAMSGTAGAAETGRSGLQEKFDRRRLAMLSDFECLMNGVSERLR